MPRLMELDTISGFNYANIRGELWDLSSTEITIFFMRIVSGVKYSDTSNINHKHGSTKDMASCVTPKSYTIYF